LPPNRPDSSRAKNDGLDAIPREGHRKGRASARPPDADTGFAAPPGGSVFPRDPGFEAPDVRDAAIATLEDSTAVQRNKAAEVLSAVADLVSTGTPHAVESGQTFAGLARKLEELEARLQYVGRTDVTSRPELEHIDAQLRDPTLVAVGAADPGQPATTGDASGPELVAREADPDPEAGIAAGDGTVEHDGPSAEPAQGADPARHLAGQSPGLEIDAAIRALTIRMAAVHREALRRGALEARGRVTRKEAPSPASPTANDGLAPALEISGGVGSGVPAFQGSTETLAGLLGHLRRLEAKVDALAGKLDAEAASAADRHQADLLARRIESTGLQLVKRLDTGFAAAAVETRVVEEMLRALTARFEAQGDIRGSLATLEQSVAAIRDRLLRLEERISSTTAAGTSAVIPPPAASETGHGLGAHEHSLAVTTPAARTPAPRTGDAPRRTEPGSARPTTGNDRRRTRDSSSSDGAREKADRHVGGAVAAIRDAASRIADRLHRIEAQLSSASRAIVATSAQGRASPPTLPGVESGTKLAGPGAGKDCADSTAATFEHLDCKGRSGSDPAADADILIEPGSGFTPPLEPGGSQATRYLGPDGDEGSSGRTDFIEAACRAVRAAHRPLETHPGEQVPAPLEPRESLGAKARRLVDRFRRMPPIRRSKSIHKLLELVGRLVPTLGSRASGSDR
jgi:hypothetical protein